MVLLLDKMMVVQSGWSWGDDLALQMGLCSAFELDHD